MKRSQTTRPSLLLQGHVRHINNVDAVMRAVQESVQHLQEAMWVSREEEEDDKSEEERGAAGGSHNHNHDHGRKAYY